MRAAFPSITVEVEEDWQDHVVHSQSADNDKVFLCPLVLLTDRSASHRGVICGSQTQRIAAEAHDYMQLDDLREDKMVMTYVSRQGVSRQKLARSRPNHTTRW
ncbi:hypothetical protein BDZ89DRAFT_1065048 [Hymenopellis radicata]|nr:hypothetical protein BDZ89DRAFT_1065048 [Hymenopellis radicata]